MCVRDALSYPYKKRVILFAGGPPVEITGSKGNEKYKNRGLPGGFSTKYWLCGVPGYTNKCCRYRIPALS